MSPAVTGLLIANVLFFGLKLVFAPEQNFVRNPIDELFALYFPYNEHLRIWQFVTHMFMHGSFSHIAFNMFGLFIFGTHLEKLWGVKRFLIFYFLSGLGAGLIYTGINVYEFGTFIDFLNSRNVSPNAIQSFLEGRSNIPYLTEDEMSTFYNLYNTPMLGASGALYGVITAFALTFPDAKMMMIFLPVPIAAKYFVPALLLIDLFSGLTGFSLFGGGIAHFAHIGGAIIGFLLMMYWRKQFPRPTYY